MEMSPLFIETFAIRNGAIVNFSLHKQRILFTLQAHGMKQDYWLQCSENSFSLPKSPNVYKGRIVYGETMYDFSAIPYNPKKVNSLQVVENNQINYTYKYAERSSLNALLENCNGADEILIVKNGFLTDTSYTNVVFFDGVNCYTPKTYLLNGTQRRYLLSKGIISEISISIKDMNFFKSVFLINALLDWEHKIEIPIKAIFLP